jgi:hypothetical protein
MANESLTRLSVNLTQATAWELRQITEQQSITLTHAVRRALALLYYFVSANGTQMDLTAAGKTKPVPLSVTLGGVPAGASGGTATSAGGTATQTRTATTQLAAGELVRLSVKLTPESTQQLKQLAKMLQVNMTEVIRRAIALLFFVASVKPEKIEIITMQGERATPPPFALP